MEINLILDYQPLQFHAKYYQEYLEILLCLLN